MLGEEWSGANTALDGEKVEDCYSQCVDELELRYANFVATLQRENSDRITLQLHNLQTHMDREASKLETLIWRLRAEQKLRGVRLQENKLKKLRQRISEQMEYVRGAEVPRHESVTVSNGVIRVK